MYEAFEFHPSQSYCTPRRKESQRDHSTFTADQARALKELGRDLSEPSLIAQYMALDPNVQDAFLERAAILEFDADMPRAQAELEAFRMVVHMIAQGQ